MEQDLSILTERQRQVYQLRQQRLTFVKIGALLGISDAAASLAYRTARRRLRDAAILREPLSAQDLRPVDFPLNHDELAAITGALLLLQREMCRKAGLSDPLHGPLPPRLARVTALLHRAQRALGQAGAPLPPPKEPE